MTPQAESSLLWGLVGVLAFLVLVQGYRLVVEPLGVGPLALGAVALAVGVTSAGLTRVLEPRIRRNGRT